MVYCSKCGKKNDEGAQFCASCGTSLAAPMKDRPKECDDRCEEECAVGPKGGRGWSIFWGLIVILVGLWIVFEVVLKNLADNYEQFAWVKSIQFEFWWIIFGIIGLLIIITGLRMVFHSEK